MAQALIGFLASLVAPLVVGGAVVDWLWPAEGRNATTRTLRRALGLALGLGLASCAFFLVGLWLGVSRTAVLGCDVWLLALAAWVLPPRRGLLTMRQGLRGPAALVLAAAALAVLALLATHAALWSAQPHGDGDAVGIWNMRARFLWTAWGQWSLVLSDGLAHVDYPLLLPMLVMRGWAWIGEPSPLVPRGLSLLLALATVGALYGALGARRGRGAAAFGVLALLGTPLFVTQSAGQLADVPFAGFLLLAVLLAEAHARQPHPGLLALAGLAAGCAAWTKNEGIALVVLTAAGLGLRALRQRDPRGLLALLAGAAVPMAALAGFKLVLSPANDLVAAGSLHDAIARGADAQRWTAVAQAFGEHLLWPSGARFELGCSYAAMLAYGLLAGRDRAQPLPWLGLLVVTAMAALYAAVFVLASPYNLDWHLRTALARLLLHLYPATILLVLLVARVPWAEGSPRA